MSEYELEDVEIVIVKRNKETGQVLQFRFPNVGHVNVSADMSPREFWDDGFARTYMPSVVESISFNGRALYDKEEGLIMEVREVAPAKRKRKK